MSTREIKLTKGLVAIVDAEDYEYLQQWVWSAVGDTRCKDKIYARGSRRNELGERCTISMHRAVLRDAISEVIDHINHDGLDNRKVNLRPATHSENMRNRKRNVNKGSGLPKGVFYSNGCKNRFAAQVRKDGVLYRLGVFDTPEKAAAAYAAGAKKLFGEFCCTL